ncbi:MAG TPA: M56 family metallopeptidase [Candidatus Methylacidiphilales bacterium]|jgi:bla regulator protein BlaR1|nr:M56 family metallopeptidase [Candidatus Methylacidiphilales bacterium]
MNALEAVFSWVLTTTWQASVLAVLILAAQWALGARLNPRWRHALWLLVVLRLVLPSLPASSLSVYQIAPAAPLNLPETISEPVMAVHASLKDFTAPQEVILPQTNFAFLYLAILWFSGALGLLLLTFLVNSRFARHVAHAPQITDESLRKIFADAKAELGIRRNIRLVESGQISSPAIMGLFTPTLILPTGARDRFSPRELRFIFLHELAHLKRGDVFIQALIALLQIIHWFNPVLWYAFRRLRADREPATDALVLSRTGEADKEPYGLMLLKLLEHFNQRHALPTLVGILEDKDQFKRRFSLIARFTRGAYGWSLLGVALLALLALACLTKATPTEPHSSANATATPMSDAEAKQKGLAALVNGKPIYWSKIASDPISRDLFLRAKSSGSAVELGIVVYEAVNHELVIQEAEASGYRVPQSVLNARIDYGVKGFGGDKNAFIENLVKNGSSLEQFNEQNRRSEIYAHMLMLHVDGPTEAYLHDHPPVIATGESPEELNKAINALHQMESTKLLNDWTNSLRAKAIIQIFADTTVSAKSDTSTQTPPAASQTTDLNVQLAHAVGQGDLAAVQMLIAQGADPKTKLSDGSTLLFHAGSPQVAEILLQHGADVNARDNQGVAVINYVCRNGGKQAAQMVSVLLSHGADPNTRDGELGETPLMDAMDAATVDVLGEHGADLTAKTTDGMPGYIFARDNPPDYFRALLRHGLPFDLKSDGPTLLCQATWSSNLPLMTDLLDRGVDPNLDGIWGMSKGKPYLAKPLENAVIEGHFEAVKLLVERGAQPDSAMIAAINNRQRKIGQFLWEHGARNISQLAYAVSQGAPVADLQKLLDHGSPADPPQDTKFSPLTIAAQLGNLNAVQLLVQRGADVNKSPVFNPDYPNYRTSPLAMAAGEGQDEVVAYLLAHGARPTPGALQNAAFNSTPYPNERPREHFEKAARLLLDAGALKDATPEEKGWVLAASVGTRQGPPNLTVLKMLLDAGLSPELPMPYLKERGEKPESVISYVRDWYQKLKEPVYPPDFAAQRKSTLDLLEAADKNAPNSASALAPPASASNAPGADNPAQLNDFALDQKLVDLIRNPSTDKVGAGDADKVGQLLAQGADPNAKLGGRPALVYALNFGKDDAAVLLIQHGADINASDGKMSAVELASMIYYCPKALDALLKKGAHLPQGRDVLDTVFYAVPAAAGKMNYLRDRNWTDAEYQAWVQRQRQVIDLLAAAGVDLNGAPGGTPPLIRAIRQGNLEGARELLKLGAKPDVHDANGETPQSAARQFHPEFLPELDAAAKRAHEASEVPPPVPALPATNTTFAPAPSPGKDSIKIELRLVEIEDRVYRANKAKVDAAVDKADFQYFNNLAGVSMLSAPSVSTAPGTKANIEIVQEFPYPTSFETGKIVPNKTVSIQGGGTTNVTLVIPPTPREFATKDVGVSAEITPAINPGDAPDPGKIVLSGRLSVTEFNGFTPSNVAGVNMLPSFTTNESLFLERIDDHQSKGLWIPGLHVSQIAPTIRDAAHTPPPANNRLLLFVSAERVP